MTQRETIIRIISSLLMAFALVSFGVVWGKAMLRRQQATTPVNSDRPLSTAQTGVAQTTTNVSRSVVVYYAHTNVRCVTCNAIERQANDALKSQLADQLAAGTVVWQTKNFQQDETFARRYGIASSVVLVVARDGEKEAGFNRLDQVWSLVDEPVKFEKYIAEAVRAWLPEPKGSRD